MMVCNKDTYTDRSIGVNAMSDALKEDNVCR